MPSDKNLNYREAEIRWTFSKLNAGNSCALVGVGSVGKSNLIRHLLRDDVRKFHLGADADALRLVYIDPNNMLEPLPTSNGVSAPGAWAGYEILTHRLYRHFHPLFAKMPPNVAEEFYEVYQNLLDGENPLAAHVALRNFEHCIDLITAQGARLVFVFDEFDAMLRELPVRFFRTLRGVRDDHKYDLMYITVTRKALADLIAENNYDYDGLEPFIELFSDNTRFISAFSDRDANAMAQELAERLNIACPPALQALIVRVSGGHAGLLRAAFSAAPELVEGLTEDEASERLVRQRGVQAECNTIWLSLNPREQEALLTIIGKRQEPVDPRAVEVRTLAEKQLIRQQGDWMTVAPPMFRTYLRTRPA